MIVRAGALTGFAAALVLIGCASASGVPRMTETSNAGKPSVPEDVFFGTKVADSFRWLERPNDAPAANWFALQANRAKAFLASLSERPALADRLRAVMAVDTVDELQYAAGRVFYLRRLAGEDSAKLCMRRLGGPEKVLFSPPRGLTVAQIRPSYDGRFLAFTISTGGSEENTVQVLAVETGNLLSDRIEKAGDPQVSWLPDRNEFYYAYYPHFSDNARRYKDVEVRQHVLGRPTSEDRTLLSRSSRALGALVENDIPEIHTSPGSPFLIAVVYRGSSSDLKILARSSASSEEAWTPIADHDDAIRDWAVAGSRLFLLSRRETWGDKVLQYDLTSSAPRPTVFAEALPGRTITALAAAKTSLYTLDQNVTGTTARSIRYSDGTVTVVPAASDAFTALVTSPDADDVLLEAQGWAESPRWLLVRSQGSEEVDVFPEHRRASIPKLAVDHLLVPSTGGVQVPLTVLRPAAVKVGDKVPTIMVGYGAFELSLRPTFSPSRMLVLEHGGILAIAHARGGGELGREWHIEGMREKKQHSIDDFLACTEAMIARGYSDARRIGAAGDSAGGLLVSVAMTQRPDLFRAVYLQGAVSDLLRVQHVGAGTITTEEFGIPDSPRAFETLLRMDAYQQIREKVAYPPILAVVGENDARVPIWQSAKLIARLQEVGDQNAYLHVMPESGHLDASEIDAEIEKRANMYAFLLKELGMTKQ